MTCGIEAPFFLRKFARRWILLPCWGLKLEERKIIFLKKLLKCKRKNLRIDRIHALYDLDEEFVYEEKVDFEDGASLSMIFFYFLTGKKII
ncbi:hypothetical protein RHMOL_Rhmol07G0296100 [Rhododendron molle]|uniref:Uncharacterized protein n=1 Tax=Rhododendron molle TaxID=49168 RepID=A0ACC0N6W5_RHOML|nr:hypothetical protein RHMOL_Rhmol07G0296100 [Rhododendron molle]